MITLIFRDVTALEDYIAYCENKYGKRPRITARISKGKLEFRSKAYLKD